MIVDSLLAGGAERIAVEVACALDRDRFEPHVLVTRHSGPLEATLQDHDVGYTIIGRSRGFALSKLRRARKVARASDLIHAHKLGSNMWGALLARTSRVPLVVVEPTFSGVRTRQRTFGYRYWIAPVSRCIICPSQRVATSLEEEGVRPELLRVIANGVSPDVAIPRAEARLELGLAPQAFVIGIVARLRAEKAHEVLLRALAELCEQGREPTLCVVGDGPREETLRRLAAELGVEKQVVWAGERRDAKRHAAAFDVGVICSDWEGLPVAALEILAAGVPIVATRVGALPLVIDNDAGILVDIGDNHGLAAALARLIDDPELRRKMGGRARARVHDEYSFDGMVTEFERVYDEILGTTPGKLAGASR
jgi:glycosyltransferase involved in cell wall biosynthesis